MTLETIYFKGSGRQFHRPNMMWAGVGRNCMFARLPYARCQIHPCRRVWYAVPVHDQLFDKVCWYRFAVYNAQHLRPHFERLLRELVCLPRTELNASRYIYKITYSWMNETIESLRPPSLPSLRLLLKATIYHSLSSSSGNSSSRQLNPSAYGKSA